MKKKVTKTFCAVLLSSVIFALPLTANAGYYTAYTSWMSWYQQMTQKWFHPYVSPEVPTNVTATYKHQGTYSVLKDHLEVNWDDCENADRYEVKVVDKNRVSKTYVTSSSILYVYDISCVSGGTVQVRSIKDCRKSKWSTAVTIGDNQLH